jgi:HEAT repeat protein
VKVSLAIRKGLILIFAGILLWVIFAVFHPFEPRYQGKRLTTWAADLLSPEEFWGMQPASVALAKQDNAAAAIRHFGIKAMPLAIKWCSVEDSAFKEKLKDLANGQKIFQVQIPSDYDYQSRGVRIFEVLGPIAKPAIPSLINLFQKKRPYTFSTASCALHYIGTDTIPPLIEALTNSNERVRTGAATTLGSFESQARDATPALIQCLKDENSRVRSAAAMSLAHLGGDTNAVISALLPCLKDKDVCVREMAAISLGDIHQKPETVVPALLASIEKEADIVPINYLLGGIARFGTNARPAIPVLVKIIESKRIMVADHALGALRKIDPDAAKPFVENRRKSLIKTNLDYLLLQTNAPAETNVPDPPTKLE